jgi:uncharacterized membrane protein (UPF0182 family)
VWAVPTETMERSDTVPMQPYYVTMRLRGEERQEFLLMLPFTPVRKQNMIAWMAARSDPPHYGELIVYKFAKGRIVQGPQQIESRIDQDTAISAQLTLWSQSGSRTIRGNLLVIPIGDAIVYVEPLYLQAETSAIPEMKRVIVASGENVVMENNLEASVAALLARGATVADSDAEQGATREESAAEEVEAARSEPSPAITDLAGLILQARLHEEAASEAMSRGDWEAFGREMAALQKSLDQLTLLAAEEAALDVARPTATPTPTPQASDDAGEGETSGEGP